MIDNIRKRLKYILPLLVAIMIIGLILSRIHQPEPSVPEPEVRINAFEAGNYIGTPAEVCGEVKSPDFQPEIGGRPTFLNLGEAYPNQPFTVVIWGENRSKWSNPPERHYANRNICVTGIIEDHEGTPQIEVTNPDQVKPYDN